MGGGEESFNDYGSVSVAMRAFFVVPMVTGGCAQSDIAIPSATWYFVKRAKCHQSGLAFSISNIPKLAYTPSDLIPSADFFFPPLSAFVSESPFTGRRTQIVAARGKLFFALIIASLSHRAWGKNFFPFRQSKKSRSCCNYARGVDAAINELSAKQCAFVPQRTLSPRLATCWWSWKIPRGRLCGWDIRADAVSVVVNGNSSRAHLMRFQHRMFAASLSLFRFLVGNSPTQARKSRLPNGKFFSRREREEKSSSPLSIWFTVDSIGS